MSASQSSCCSSNSHSSFDPKFRHPLDPLSAEEIGQVIQAIRQDQRATSKTRFISAALQEPLKGIARSWQMGQPLNRIAFVILLNTETAKTYEVAVRIEGGEIVQWKEIPNVQPAITLDEFAESENALKEDPEFKEALARRGITNMDLPLIDIFSAGAYGPTPENKVRLARAFTWLRQEIGDNAYARPVDGLIAWIDLNSMKMVKLEDTGIYEVPPTPGEYAPKFHPQMRVKPKPLEIVQPEGPSFQVEGYQVKWMNWSFRVGFTPREGLVLYQVDYNDEGKVRPLIDRAALSEMVVPYGDPNLNHAWLNAFDAGEFGLGMLANSLLLGCDCLGVIHYFDAHLTTSWGELMTIKNAVCMHEEDYGILWKHYDWRSNETEVRRSRRLVVSFIATVSNYEYGFYWYFYLDGSIQLEVKLTGILNTGALPVGEKRKYGTVVAPGLYAPIHQHIFNVRLDMNLDGSGNSLYEVNTHRETDKKADPYLNAFYAEETGLATEKAAVRDMDLATARHWKIANPNSLNPLNEPVSYKLIPGANTVPMVDPQSSVRQRAGFMDHHLWATRYDAAELYAAGNYPTQRHGSQAAGLPLWAQRNGSLENTDLVVWYTMIAHHIPRTEDWPVMPCEYIGFHLKPSGFFSRNPAIHLP